MNKGNLRHLARRARPAWLATAFALLVLPSHAATHLWTGKGTTAKWSEAANWNGRVPELGDGLVFPAGSATLTCTNDLADLFLVSITFSGSNYVVYGDPLALRGDLRADHVSGRSVFHPNIRLSGATTSTCASATASLLLNGDIELSGNVLTLAGNGTNELAGAVTGFNGLTKIGTGTLVLSGPRRNTYINANFNEGTVLLRKTIANGAMAGGLTVGNASGPSAYVVTDSRVAQLNNEPIIIHAGSRLVLRNGRESAFDVTGGGRLELDGAVLRVLGHYPPDPNNPGFLGDIAGSGEVQKVGVSELTLSGTNTFAGEIKVFGGSLVLNGQILNARVVKVSPNVIFVGNGVTNLTESNGTFSPRRSQ
jgi:fibronectin-binding autotransporter adhesin